MKTSPLLFVFLLAAAGPVPAQESPAEAAPKKPERAPASGSDRGTSGEEAVKRVKNLGFRLNSREKAETPPVEGTVSAEAGEAPSMQLGKVEEPVALPAELAGLAQEGALAVADGDWNKARELYLQLVKAAPDNALAYANLGVAEHQLGNLLAAAGNLGRSTQLNPHIARNWQTLGLIHYERGELALALSCLTRAVHEAPRDPETRIILAAVARDFGWPEAALTELQRAVEIDPRSATAQYNLAVTYLGEEPPRLELARRHYYAAIDLGTPPSPELEALLNAGP